MNTNEANRQIAAENRDFQAHMSNTSYQRAVADMQRAGLNPMLAYQQGGASTPGGAMATMEDALGKGINSGFRGAQLEPQIAQVRALTRKTDAETDKVGAEAELARSQALVNAVQVPRIEQETKTGVHSASKLQQEVLRLWEENQHRIGHGTAREVWYRSHEAEERARELASRNRATADRPAYGESMANIAMEHARAAAVERLLLQLSVPRAENEERVRRGSWWMKEVSPYLGDVGRAISSGASLRYITR